MEARRPVRPRGLRFKEDGRVFEPEDGGLGTFDSGLHPPRSQARVPSLEGGRRNRKPGDLGGLVDPGQRKDGVAESRETRSVVWIEVQMMNR